MIGEVLKIKFKDDMAFLTDEVALNFTQVQVEIAGKPVKRFKAPAFWTIRVINLIPEEKKLYAEVLNYQVGETQFPVNQIVLADALLHIEKVTFRSIDTGGLLGTVNGTLTRAKLPTRSEPVYRPQMTVYPEAKVTRESIKQTYTNPFSVPIKHVKFLDGKVRFEKKIQEFKRPVQFEIANPVIIEAYDAIKNYFEKVLKTKTIQVIPLVTSTDRVIDTISATSSEIDRIDATLIEEVKFEWVKALRNKEMADEQQLLTIEEFLQTLKSERLDAQQFFKDEDEFFDNMLERSGTKHHSHLRFLSSKQSHELTKLRLIQKPWSFVFLITGAEQFHIVWETLDTTEATYIWSFLRDIKKVSQILKEVNETIRLVLQEGKNTYIIRKEQNFERVWHDYKDLKNGFRNWKEEIEKIIEQ